MFKFNTIDGLHSHALAAIRAHGSTSPAAADIDRWLLEAGIDVEGHLASDLAAGLFLGGVGDAAICIAWLHCVGDWDKTVPAMLSKIKAEFGGDADLVSYLESRARDALAEAAEQACLKGAAALDDLLRNCRCTADDVHLLFDYGGKIPLDRTVAAFVGHPVVLCSFRSRLRKGLDFFDAAVAMRRADFEHDVRHGFTELFSTGSPPSPSEFLAAFAGVPEVDGTLRSALGQLSSRVRVRDGFANGQSASEWLKALALLRFWSAADLRTLVSFMAAVPQGAVADLAAATKTAIMALVVAEPTEAALGALSLLRLARIARESTLSSADQTAEAECLEFVAALPGGDAVASLWGVWRAVPVRPGKDETAWSWLSAPVRRHWASKVLACVEAVPEAAGRRSLAAAVVHFALRWSPKEVAAEIEWALVELVERYGLHEDLGALAGTEDAVCALRAGALHSYLSLGKPP